MGDNRRQRRTAGPATSRPRRRGHSGKPRTPQKALTNTSSSASPGLFRREGEYWTLSYAGLTVRLQDALGIHCLAYLLARPHQRVAVIDLLPAGSGNGTADAERARSTVSKRIKRTIAKISQHHPSLGYHLSTTIRTGCECVYQADPEKPPTWIL